MCMPLILCPSTASNMAYNWLTYEPTAMTHLYCAAWKVAILVVLKFIWTKVDSCSGLYYSCIHSMAKVTSLRNFQRIQRE